MVLDRNAQLKDTPNVTVVVDKLNHLKDYPLGFGHFYFNDNTHFWQRR
jgi:hypothetical protein